MWASAEPPKYGATTSSPALDEKEAQLSDDAVTCEGAQWRILVLVGLLCTATISEGYDLGVVNGAIVQIQEHFNFSSHQVGFVIAATPAATFIGALLHGAIADHFGRRLGLVSAVSFLVAGPLVMATASDITALILGRILCGFGIGGGLLVVTIYIAELAPADQRGRLVACQEVALNFGMVLGFLMGWVLLGMDNDWRWMLMLGSILPLPLASVLLAVYVSGAADDAFLPETPRWLAQRKRFDSALQVSTRYLQSPRYQSNVEAGRKIAELQQAYEKEDEDFVSWGTILWAWGDRPLLRMLLAGILVAVGEMICGGTSIGYYSSSIMADSLGKSTAFFATVIMGIVRLTGVILAAGLMDHAGRRTLLLSSAVVMTVACIWVAFAARHHTGVAWMLPAGLCLMMLGFVLGLGSVSLVYISEIFPTRIRQKGMVICMFWCRLAGASSALAYPILIDSYGIDVTFLAQAAINFSLLCLLWLMVRETKGLSLEQAYKLFDE